MRGGEACFLNLTLFGNDLIEERIFCIYFVGKIYCAANLIFKSNLKVFMYFNVTHLSNIIFFANHLNKKWYKIYLDDLDKQNLFGWFNRKYLWLIVREYLNKFEIILLNSNSTRHFVRKYCIFLHDFHALPWTQWYFYRKNAYTNT